jgi:AhpC/TSA family
MTARRHRLYARFVALPKVSLNAALIRRAKGEGTNVLKIGDFAPDFTLPAHNGPKVTLSQFRGRQKVVLAFYPLDWTPV